MFATCGCVCAYVVCKTKGEKERGRAEVGGSSKEKERVPNTQGKEKSSQI